MILAFRALRATACCALALGLWSGQAHAQLDTEVDGVTAEMRLVARELAVRGAAEFDSGEYAAALEHFDHAAAILDVPSIAIMQARTLVKLVRWVEALDRFQQVARLHLESDAPDAFHDAVRDAAVEGDALSAQMPRINIVVDPKVASDPRVEVFFDGRQLPTVLLNVARPVDPGQHLITARSAGRTTFQQRVQAVPREQQEVQVPLILPRRVSKPTTDVKPGEAEDATSSSGRSEWLMPAAVGVGSLGLAGAMITTLVGSGYQSSLDATCSSDGSPHVCPESARGDINALGLQRTLFVLSMGAATLGGGVATYLLISDHQGSAEVAAFVSPTSVGLKGKF